MICIKYGNQMQFVKEIENNDVRLEKRTPIEIKSFLNGKLFGDTTKCLGDGNSPTQYGLIITLGQFVLTQLKWVQHPMAGVQFQDNFQNTFAR